MVNSPKVKYTKVLELHSGNPAQASNYFVTFNNMMIKESKCWLLTGPFLNTERTGGG
jgi:hypothetical protein